MFWTLAALILTLALLVLAATPVHATECPTEESKLDAIVDFVDEHYGSAFTVISSPPDDPALFMVEFWLYDERETACKGAVRVSDDCVLSVATTVECDQGTD